MLENYWGTDFSYNQSHRNHFDYVDQTQLSSRLCFIHDSSLKVYQHDIAHDADLIYKCKIQTGRMPVLCLDSNPYNVEKYLLELEQHIDPQDFFVFNPDIRTNQSLRSNLAPWPSWLINQHLHKNFQANQPKTKRISFLSGVPRYHRLLLFKHIRPWVRDNDVVVVNSFSSENYWNMLPQNLEPGFEKWLDEIPWANQDKYFDTDQSCAVANNQAENNHPAYSACINITGETLGHGTQVLPSEKTWKAYRSGCLVINFGIQQMPETLQNLGIEIWHEYDTADATDVKCKKIVELFQRNDVEDLYQRQRKAIEHNQNLVNSVDFVKKLCEPAIKKLKAHVKF